MAERRELTSHHINLIKPKPFVLHGAWFYLVFHLWNLVKYIRALGKSSHLVLFLVNCYMTSLLVEQPLADSQGVEQGLQGVDSDSFSKSSRRSTMTNVSWSARHFSVLRLWPAKLRAVRSDDSCSLRWNCKRCSRCTDRLGCEPVIFFFLREVSLWLLRFGAVVLFHRTGQGAIYTIHRVFCNTIAKCSYVL
jgi:hypothetical protein